MKTLTKMLFESDVLLLFDDISDRIELDNDLYILKSFINL